MNAENGVCENVFRRPQIFSSVKKSLRLLQNRVQATHLFLKGDDLGWGTPGLGDDLGWGDEATRDAQECGGAPPPWDCLRGILQELQILPEWQLRGGMGSSSSNSAQQQQ